MCARKSEHSRRSKRNEQKENRRTRHNCGVKVFELLFDILRDDSWNNKNVNKTLRLPGATALFLVQHKFQFWLNKQLRENGFHQESIRNDWTTSKWNGFFFGAIVNVNERAQIILCRGNGTAELDTPLRFGFLFRFCSFVGFHRFSLHLESLSNTYMCTRTLSETIQSKQREYNTHIWNQVTRTIELLT